MKIVDVSAFATDSLTELMNGPVKKDLGLPVDHGRQSNTVFAYLSEDFMKPVIDKGTSKLKVSNVTCKKSGNYFNCF